MNIKRVVGEPTPKTVWVRVSARCGHLRQAATVVASVSRSGSRFSGGRGGLSKPLVSKSDGAAAEPTGVVRFMGVEERVNEPVVASAAETTGTATGGAGRGARAAPAPDRPTTSLASG